MLKAVGGWVWSKGDRLVGLVDLCGVRSSGAPVVAQAPLDVP